MKPSYLMVSIFSKKAQQYFFQTTLPYRKLFAHHFSGIKVMYNCEQSRIILNRLEKNHPNKFSVWYADVFDGELDSNNTTKRALQEADFPEKFRKIELKCQNSIGRRPVTSMSIARTC